MPAQATDTLTQILDTAEDLIQTRGYNAVSFRDLAERVGVKSASIHYYFQNKGSLGAALVGRYSQRFAAARDTIDQRGGSSLDRLRRYTRLLSDTFKTTGRMCLCGILAAEASTLPVEVNSKVREFFEENERWLTQVLDAGRKRGELKFDGPPAEAAKALFASMEGALMSAWTFGDEARLASALKWAVAAVSK